MYEERKCLGYHIVGSYESFILHLHPTECSRSFTTANVCLADKELRRRTSVCVFPSISKCAGILQSQTHTRKFIVGSRSTTARIFTAQFLYSDSEKRLRSTCRSDRGTTPCQVSVGLTQCPNTVCGSNSLTSTLMHSECTRTLYAASTWSANSIMRHCAG